MELEIETMPRKGATQMVEDSQNQFLSLMLLVDSGYRPKHFLCSFQNESSHTFKGDCSHRSLLCKLDLKDVYCQQHLTKLPGIVEGFHGEEIFTNFFVGVLCL